jgi:hypothetical protein
MRIPLELKQLFVFAAAFVRRGKGGVKQTARSEAVRPHLARERSERGESLRK